MPSSETVVQLAFELSAPVELANYWSVLYRDPSFVEHGRAAVRATIAKARPQAGSRQARRVPPGR